MTPAARGGMVESVDDAARSLEETEVAHSSEELGAFSVARDGTIVMASPRALEMTGYELFDLLGKPFADLIADESAAQARASFAETLQGKDTDVEITILKKDGGTVRVRARSTPDRDGDEILGSIGTLEELESD